MSTPQTVELAPTPRTRRGPLARLRVAWFGSLTGVTLILAFILVVASLISPFFLTSYNVTIILRTLAFVGLVTIGQATLMLLGELDLSLGAIGGLTAVLAGIMMVNASVTPVVAILAASSSEFYAACSTGCSLPFCASRPLS